MTARHYGSSEESRGLGARRKRENWEGDWLGGGKRKTKCKERKRESEGRKDERSRASERKERNERDRRWRNPLHMSLFTWIYYSCGGKVLMGGVPVSFSAQKKKCLLALANGEGLEELFPRFTLLSEDFAAASIFYLLLLSVLIFLFLFIPFTLASLLTCDGVSVKPTIFFVLHFFKPLCFLDHFIGHIIETRFSFL